jgi:Peptidase family M50.
MEKRGIKLVQWISLFFMFICFYLGLTYINQFSDNTGLFVGLIAVLVAVLIGMFLHVVLHELGHLVAGLLSEHRFVALCLFRVTFVKENGKLKLKKYRIPGISGGCMMLPPEMKNGTYPFKLYFSGGLLVNFLFSIICLILFYQLADVSGLWAEIFLIIGLLGVLIGVLNLIPSNLVAPSDGYALFNMGKEENTTLRHGFWSCSSIQALDTEGVRPRDIPIELYDWIDMNNVNNVFVLGTAGNQYKSLLDKQEFDQARELMRFLCDNTQNISELQRISFNIDLLFHELTNECRQEEIDRLYTEKLKKFIKLARTDTSVQRVLYAYARLALKDDIKAKEHLDLFNKACARSIFSGTVLCEQELVAYVDAIANERESPL